MKFKLILIALLLLSAPLMAENGKINVVTDVENAEIYINGQYVGKNSVNNYPLEEGSHYVQVKYENKVRYAEKVTLEGKFRLVLSERAGLAAGISMKQKQLQELEQKYLDTSLELDKTDLSKVDTLAQEIGDQQQAIEKDLDHISGEVQKLEGLLFYKKTRKIRVSITC
jgi:hypothetical protein